jgi:hypothetical protein
MKRESLIRLLRRYAAKNGFSFAVDQNRGKGSHYRVTLGGHTTTGQSGELPKLHVRRICS